MPAALDICIACKHSRTGVKTPQNAVACDADPARRSIMVIAEERDCPLNLHPSVGAGDTLKKIIRATGLEKPGKALRTAVRKLTGKEGCGCGGSQAKWNRRIPYKPAG